MGCQTENRVKPNGLAVYGHLRGSSWVHYVFGCIGRRVGFEGIDAPTSAFLTPFNPTYGTKLTPMGLGYPAPTEIRKQTKH